MLFPMPMKSRELDELVEGDGKWKVMGIFFNILKRGDSLIEE